MVAVYIDPLVCHTWLYYITPECWGIVLYGALLASFPVALACAVTYRRLLRVAR